MDPDSAKRLAEFTGLPMQFWLGGWYKEHLVPYQTNQLYLLGSKYQN